MTPPPTLLERARAAVEQATGDPAAAAAAAEQVLADTRPLDPAVRGTALWALGLARREQGALQEAHRRFEEALAVTADLPALSAEIRSSHATLLAQQGDLEGALAATTAAIPHLTGTAAARNRYQRALFHQRMGRHDEALADYAAAEPVLVTHGDTIGLARLLLNRSALHTYAGRHDRATADLERALHHSTADGQPLMAALCAQNLGFTAGRRGDIPAALAWFDRADAALQQLGNPPDRRASAALDRAEVLLAAGLLEEARLAADAAVQALRAGDNRLDLAEALVVSARIAVLADDPAAAIALAEEAAALFDAQHREAWASQARFVAATATGHGGDPDELVALGELLVAQGWDAEGRQVLIQAAREALDAGDPTRARTILAPFLHAGQEASAVLRAQAWHAAALAERAAGRLRSARSRIRAGLATIDQHRLTLGSAELRAHATRHAAALVGLWLDLALSADRPWEVLRAVEAWRSRSLDFPAARPPADPELAALLAELRTVEAELRARTAAGEPTGALQDRRHQLESAIRRADRRTEATARAPGWELDLRAVRAAAATRTLVHYVAVEGVLHAVRVSRDGARLVHLGPLGPLRQLVGAAIAGLHRMASGHGSAAGLELAEQRFDDAVRALDRALVEPLDLPGLSDQPVVIVPTGDLHRIPWGGLPGLRGRPLTITPSLSSWTRAEPRRPKVSPAARVVLVQGPEVPGATAELAALATRYHDPLVLTGEAATTDAVLAALDGADVAHLAAHGRFRHDNPLFSALRMADGPLTVHDLERLTAPPGIVVMPSCDTAVSEALVGDELLGLSAALLRLGVASLLAPVVPIPDEATATLAVALHDRLLAGEDPAAALAAATATAPDATPRDRAVRHAFVALGS